VDPKLWLSLEDGGNQLVVDGRLSLLRKLLDALQRGEPVKDGAHLEAPAADRPGGSDERSG
jgi:hypothetical protein